LKIAKIAFRHVSLFCEIMSKSPAAAAAAKTTFSKIAEALSELKELIGEGLAGEAPYAFSYTSSGFAVSNTLHTQDLPPINWLTRVVERLGSDAASQFFPDIVNWWMATTPTDEKIDDDAYIALSQVAGFNPLVLRQCQDSDFLHEKFAGIFSWTFPDGDSFAAAFESGRVFVSDYKDLEVIQPSTDEPGKQIFIPIGIFRIPLGQPLEVVAIKTGQGAEAPVFRPGDAQWRQAKLAFNCADANYHELISHLGRTHLLIEPFVVSTTRIFLENHWVRRLLEPHLCGTANINALAFKVLINPGGVIDQLLCGDLTSELALSFDSIQRPGFRQLMPPTFLADRGLMDPQLLYPYRDDALLVWGAIHTWVSNFARVNHCNSDESVAQDLYIQNWVSDLTVGGKVSGLGEVVTRADLIDVLTMVIFTSSAQHAAVNYPQADQMQDAHAVPMALYGNVNTDTVEQVLPPKNMITLQKQVADLLAGTIHSHSHK
jgi:arachidonate 15-lipoxygenase